jgi:hypothetical protein
MNRTGRVLTASAFVVALVAAFAYSTRTSAQDTDTKQKWEYLIVADGGNSLNSVSSPGQRKQKDFGREAVTVERNLDRLGADGWELVAVSGTPNEPTYTLKRHKN